MFDKYVIVDGSVRAVQHDGAVTGFAFDTRIAYYRGLGLSMVEPFEVRIGGGSPVPQDDLRFTVGGRTWTFAQLEQEYDARWELRDVATVTVLLPGGLPPGEHELAVTEVLRVSYLPTPSRTTCVRRVSALTTVTG